MAKLAAWSFRSGRRCDDAQMPTEGNAPGMPRPGGFGVSGDFLRVPGPPGRRWPRGHYFPPAEQGPHGGHPAPRKVFPACAGDNQLAKSWRCGIAISVNWRKFASYWLATSASGRWPFISKLTPARQFSRIAACAANGSIRASTGISRRFTGSMPRLNISSVTAPSKGSASSSQNTTGDRSSLPSSRIQVLPKRRPTRLPSASTKCRGRMGNHIQALKQRGRQNRVGRPRVHHGFNCFEAIA